MARQPGASRLESHSLAACWHTLLSGRALKPLRDFAAQAERVQPDNLSEIRLSEDVPTELQRCSASFNDMIARLGEGFSAQRQFTGNAAHELRTPLALMQAQIELFISEHSGLQPETAELLGLLQEQTERMSRMTKVLLEMSELRSVPCEDDVELGPLSEEVLTDLAPLAENKGIALNCAGDALDNRERYAPLSAGVQPGRKRHPLQPHRLELSTSPSATTTATCSCESRTRAREYPSSTVRASSNRSFAWTNPAAGHTAAQDSG